MRKQAFTLWLYVLTAPFTLAAEGMTAVGSFYKQPRGTVEQIPIVSALMSDHVFFSIMVKAKDGEHTLQFTIYDGQGKEVMNAERVVIAKNNVATATVAYGFEPRRDAPGTWWYVAALDNKIVVSSSIQVLNQKPNNALKAGVPSGTGP